MTREEAIYELKNAAWLGTDHSIERTEEAVEMAIQALSQEPTFDDECQKDMDEAWEQIQKKRKRIPVTLDLTPCDDAISRDWLKTAIHNFYYGLKHTPTEEDIQAYIDVAPSVTQKSGKWIPFSERLPKPFEHCLITTTDGEVIYHYDDGQYSKYKAWMPLPEPYESQESEEQ